MSNDLNITSLIDWQHCALLPLFLQCGIPNSPKLRRQYLGVTHNTWTTASLRRSKWTRTVLAGRASTSASADYFYVAATAKLNQDHYDALTRNFSTLRRKLFDHASSPWEDDNITLKADLIKLEQDWSDMITSNSITSNGAEPFVQSGSRTRTWSIICTWMQRRSNQTSSPKLAKTLSALARRDRYLWTGMMK